MTETSMAMPRVERRVSIAFILNAGGTAGNYSHHTTTLERLMQAADAQRIPERPIAGPQGKIDHGYRAVNLPASAQPSFVDALKREGLIDSHAEVYSVEPRGVVGEGSRLIKLHAVK